MARQKRDDFYEALERIERELDPLIEADRAAFRRLSKARVGTPEFTAALADYRIATAAHDKAFLKRVEFLKKYRP